MGMEPIVGSWPTSDRWSSNSGGRSSHWATSAAMAAIPAPLPMCPNDTPEEEEGGDAGVEEEGEEYEDDEELDEDYDEEEELFPDEELHLDAPFL